MPSKSSKTIKRPSTNTSPQTAKSKPAAAKRSIPLKVSHKPAVKTAKLAKAGEKPKASAAPAADLGGYVLENQVGFRLRKAQQRATQIFAEVMAEHDVTPTQFAALAKLDDLGAISQNQLGRLTAMDPATILGVVGRLYRQNWLRARPSVEDQRLMLIELTAEGQARIKLMKDKAARVTKQTLAPLSADEAQTFNALLQRLG